MENNRNKKEELEKKVYELILGIAVNSGLEVRTIRDETNILNDLGFDSVALIELIVEIENEFNVEMDEDDMDVNNLVVVGNLISMIDERISL